VDGLGDFAGAEDAYFEDLRGGHVLIEEFILEIEDVREVLN
jgi:hypothetical protein